MLVTKVLTQPGDRGRLLFVVNEAYGLLSHRLAVATAAQRAGWEIHVAAPPDHVWAPPGFSERQLEERGFRFHAVPLSRRGQNPIADLRTLVALLRLYRRLQPRLVHHVTLKPNVYGGIAARLTRVPAAIFAITGLGHVFVARGAVAGLLRRAVTRLLALVFRHSNARVIFQNAEDRRRLLEAGAAVARKSVLIRGSGVDVRRLRPIPEPRGRPVVALCARMIWEKGVREFVEAARFLRDRGTTARFILIGDTQPSNPRAVPVETLREWDREGTVEWWGYRQDMNAVFASVHVVCLPSTYGEGVPKVLLEAAACGRPVVATRCPGCSDAVSDGASGILVPPGDPPALADALHRLIRSEDLRRAMGARGRRLVEEKFDERDVADRTLQVYSQLAEQC